MPLISDSNLIGQERWFVLNYLSSATPGKKGSAQDYVKKFNDREHKSLQIFAPSFISYRESEGKNRTVSHSLTFHYVFVKGDFSDIKKLCGEDNNFSFLLDRGSEERYAIVGDREMDNFKRIARAYSNQLPYYSLDGVDLQDFDRVEVVEGDFPGLQGYYSPSKGSSKGRIILKITQNMATVAYDIKAKYIRVIEFSKNFNRAYDIIDAFIPKLYRSLRKFVNQDSLTEKEISELNSFCRRMGRCRLNNDKIEAKLYYLLVMANHILGDEDEENMALARYEKKENSVTSLPTKAFLTLLKSLHRGDSQLFFEGEKLLDSIGEKKSKAIEELRDEYQFYSHYFRRDFK